MKKRTSIIVLSTSTSIAALLPIAIPSIPLSLNSESILESLNKYNLKETKKNITNDIYEFNNKSIIFDEATSSKPNNFWTHEFNLNFYNSNNSINCIVHRGHWSNDNPGGHFKIKTKPIIFDFKSVENNIIGNYQNSKVKYDEIIFKLLDFKNIFKWKVQDDSKGREYDWTPPIGTPPPELITSSNIFGTTSTEGKKLYAETKKGNLFWENDSNYETEIDLNLTFSNKQITLEFDTLNYVQSLWLNWDAKFWININKDIIPKIQYTLPYSDDDRKQFTNIFNQIFSNKKFVFYSDSLVGFPSSNLNNDSNENKKKIETEINKRIDNFFNDSRIKNSKLGTIAKGLTSEINYDSSESIDVKGEIDVGINFELLNGDKFMFNGKEAESFLKTKMTIQIKPNQHTKYPVNELVQIEPYNVSGQGSGTFSKSWTGNGNNIVIKPPEEDYIPDFKFNLNKINDKGVRDLIPFEKMPIVRKYGAKINLKLKLEIQNEKKPIEFNLNFNSIYGNGKIIVSKTIKPFTLTNGNILSFNDNGKIDFSLNVKENDIFLEFATPPKINIFSNTSKDSRNVSLSIVSGEAIIPKDQVVTKSKWKTIHAAKVEDENGFTDAGTYWTEDPFTFRLTNTTIPINQEGVTTFDSRFKPYIGGEALGLSGTGAGEDGSNDYFYADLGQYVMAQKEKDGTVDIEIIVKEFVPANNRTGVDPYSKEVWKIVIKVDKISSASSFLLAGWNSNQIDIAEKEKFFDKENKEYFRGDIVDEKTGMYIPKIAWVNSPPPEGFTFDPLDENGEIISGNNEIKNYDVGYIAQINATGFLNNEFKSMPTIGGYETIFDPKEYIPTGSYPYSEYYTYGKNGIIPIIERVPLIDSGALSNKKELKQTVLKRNNNYSFLYQFSLISSMIEKNIFDLYSGYEGDNNKALFVDFWTTNQGKHLTNYLISKSIKESVEEVMELEYFDVIQYWNIYVNDPIHYISPTNPGIDNNYGIDISKWKIGAKLLKINVLDALGIEVRKYIRDSMNSFIKNEEIYIEPGYLLTEGVDYKIEVDKEQFETKLNMLLNQYNLPLSQTKNIDFKVISLKKKDDSDYIKNSVIIKFRNNKNIDDILNLANLSPTIIKINTNEKDVFPDGIDKVALIREIIYTSVNNEINKFVNEQNASDINLKLDEHYKIEFYSKKYNSETGKIDNFYYRNINEAIRFCLLEIEDEMKFNNTLFLNVKAIESDENYFIYGSYSKKINNSDENPGLSEYSKINFNDFIVNDIKVNTEDEFFPLDPKDPNHTEQKIKIMSDLIYKRIQNDIDFYSREQYFQTNERIEINTHYELKFSKKDVISGNIIEYIDITSAITLGLLNNLTNPKFDNTIIIDVIAINPNPNELAEGKFTKIVNNSYLNQGVEPDPGVPGEVYPDNINPPTLDDNLLEDGENITSNSEILWWTITPFVLLIAVASVIVTIIKVRKKHKIN